MKTHTASETIAVDGPVVIIPAREYELLLKEAGYRSTPKLEKRITQARDRLSKGKFLKWVKVKHELI